MKKYMVEYTLLVKNNTLHHQYITKAMCKLHALIRFRINVKHKKNLKRKILKVRRIKYGS